MAKQQYALTPSDASKGGRAAASIARQQIRLKRAELRIQVAAQAVEVITSMLKSPVISGVVAYGMVIGADMGGLFKSSTVLPKQLNTSVIGTLFNDLFGTTISNVASVAEVDVLKGAIVAYIASGGNLAGLLSSGGADAIGKTLNGAIAAVEASA